MVGLFKMCLSSYAHFAKIGITVIQTMKLSICIPLLTSLSFVLPVANLLADSPSLTYPSTRKVEQVDDYNGVRIADPYRWLEDDNAADTKAWVTEQNKVTFGFLEQIPERKSIKERMTKLWNFERYSVPGKE